tara:strand:+ start:1984 stop:2925 length:942 start_codon:yes stop_codon:yes gene_type:complete
MSSFLITGGAGFIGSHLAEYVLSQGHYAVILDNFSTGSYDNLRGVTAYPDTCYRIIDGDICNRVTCQQATKGVDYVLHHAALGSVPESLEHPDTYEKNNVQGTLTILQAAVEAGVKKVVQASSASVYGHSLVVPKIESMMPEPMSPYALSKLACEYYGAIFTHHHNLAVISLRYFNVFGPRQNPHSQYAAVVPRFIHALQNNQSPTIYGDGTQTRDFTYIDNVIQANINSCYASKQASGQVFNIGNGTHISIQTLATTIAKLLNKNYAVTYAPHRAGDIKASVADITRAKTYLSYTNLVDIHRGLTLMLQPKC